MLAIAGYVAFENDPWTLFALKNVRARPHFSLTANMDQSQH